MMPPRKRRCRVISELVSIFCFGHHCD
jgi:hypothetical protein